MLNAEARSAGKRTEKQASLPGDFLREGLSAVLSVQLREPEFEGQTKSRLGNPEVRAIVSEVVGEAPTADKPFVLFFTGRQPAENDAEAGAAAHRAIKYYNLTEASRLSDAAYVAPGSNPLWERIAEACSPSALEALARVSHEHRSASLPCIASRASARSCTDRAIGPM